MGDGQGPEEMESIIGWRDRISQQHRAQYKAERFVRQQREALMQEREQRSRRDIPSISEAIKELVEIKDLEEA